MSLDPTDISLARLVAQRVAGPPCATPADAVSWMSAIQAQDHHAALMAVALRSATGRLADVEAAMTDGAVVRSWPMRGTLHLVAAADLGWMLELTAARSLAAARRPVAQVGLTEHDFAAAADIARQALRGGGHHSREELMRLWGEHGVNAAGGRGSHLVRHLAQTGVLCWGPVHDGVSHAVLVEEWITAPRRLEREEALGEWAGRYFASHGPATVADFARWTGLTTKDARTGVALARSGLERVDVEGVEHLMDPATPARLAAHRSQARGVFLLPGFDEMVLGYADRSATVPVEVAGLIVPGGNGIFAATVVDDGRVVGTWRRAGRGASQAVTVTPFTTLPPAASAALPGLVEALPAR